jgi:hypothetical protein
MKYRKKPVVIDAWPIKDIIDQYWGLGHLDEAVSRAIDDGTLKLALNGIYIKTPEGGMFGRLEDWLIMGVHNEFYPCKPEVFVLTFEEADGTAA